MNTNTKIGLLFAQLIISVLLITDKGTTITQPQKMTI